MLESINVLQGPVHGKEHGTETPMVGSEILPVSVTPCDPERHHEAPSEHSIQSTEQSED